MKEISTPPDQCTDNNAIIYRLILITKFINNPEEPLILTKELIVAIQSVISETKLIQKAMVNLLSSDSVKSILVPVPRTNRPPSVGLMIGESQEGLKLYVFIDDTNGTITTKRTAIKL